MVASLPSRPPAPPPVTVVDPRRPPRPVDVLEAGPPRPPVPASGRVALAAVVVLAAGVAQAVAYDTPPPPPPPPARALRTATLTGVSASAAVNGQPGGPLLERFALRVQVAPTRARGDSASPSTDDVTVLLAVTGRGFFLEPAGAVLPLPVGPPDRRGARLDLDLLAQVSDCAVDSQAQRTLELQVRRGAREGLVRVAVDGEVVRLLDRLVARTCRRPRG